MYARQLEDRTLTLAVDGRLWKDGLVLYDQETNTRWSQMTGVAKAGPLKSKILTPLASVMTDWQGWRHDHPDGTVVMAPHGERQFTRAFYRDGEDFVLGIAADDKAKHWSLKELGSTRVVNDDWEGRPVVVLFDRDSLTARLYSREVDGQVLTFRADKDKMMDAQTGTLWDPTTGKANGGPKSNCTLDPIPGAVISRRDAWVRFHPQ